MNVICKRPFNEAASKYPNERVALMDMYRTLSHYDFKTPDQLRAIYPSLDNFKYKDKWWVLDVGGNHLRVIIFIQFLNKRMYVKHIVNHDDYNKLTQKYRKATDRR